MTQLPHVVRPLGERHPAGGEARPAPADQVAMSEPPNGWRVRAAERQMTSGDSGVWQTATFHVETDADGHAVARRIHRRATTVPPLPSRHPAVTVT